MADEDVGAAVRIMKWMRDMMDVHGLNYNQWASRAGVSATTISRFMSGKSPHIPSSRTLSALARVVGSQPPFVQQDYIVEMVVIPLLSSAQVQDIARGGTTILTAMTDSRDSVVTSALRYKDAFIVFIDTDTMNASGIMKGDQVVVAPHEMINEGDVIAIATAKGASAYRYLPPFLMPVTHERDMKPIKLHKNIRILGPIVQLIRNVF